MLSHGETETKETLTEEVLTWIKWELGPSLMPLKLKRVFD